MRSVSVWGRWDGRSSATLSAAGPGGDKATEGDGEEQQDQREVAPEHYIEQRGRGDKDCHQRHTHEATIPALGRAEPQSAESRRSRDRAIHRSHHRLVTTRINAYTPPAAVPHRNTGPQ